MAANKTKKENFCLLFVGLASHRMLVPRFTHFPRNSSTAGFGLVVGPLLLMLERGLKRGVRQFLIMNESLCLAVKLGVSAVSATVSLYCGCPKSYP